VQRSGDRVDGNDAGDPSRLADAVRHPLLIVGIVCPAAWLMVACSSGEDLVTTAAPTPQTHGSVHARPDIDLQSTTLDVTPAQRGFLDALTATGVRPSSELEALSIGSYVCQAHAAGQSDEAVWDYIAPMVRSDATDARSTTSPHTAPEPQVNEAIADYIRIATQRLCN
jgi:hypothetical protein